MQALIVPLLIVPAGVRPNGPGSLVGARPRSSLGQVLRAKLFGGLFAGKARSHNSTHHRLCIARGGFGRSAQCGCGYRAALGMDRYGPAALAMTAARGSRGRASRPQSLPQP